MRLYHPELGREYETGSDDPDHLALFTDKGWQPAPEPVVQPGYQPEPVVYAPVQTPDLEALAAVATEGAVAGVEKLGRKATKPEATD